MNDKPDRIVFHYNKKHNESPTTIPPWTIKCKGNTFYVWHFTSEVGFTTKETPESEHTKGALQFRGRLNLYGFDEETNQAQDAVIKT